MEHGLVANGDIKADSYSLGVILFESHCSLATKEEKYKVGSNNYRAFKYEAENTLKLRCLT